MDAAVKFDNQAQASTAHQKGTELNTASAVKTWAPIAGIPAIADDVTSGASYRVEPGKPGWGLRDGWAWLCFPGIGRLTCMMCAQITVNIEVRPVSGGGGGDGGGVAAAIIIVILM